MKIFKTLKISRENAGLLGTIYFAFFTSGMMSTLLGSILPFMKEDYQMSYLLSGMVLSAHQIGNLCAVLIAGFLPYAIGRKKSTVSLCLGILIGLVLMTLSGNPLLLLISFAATGIGRGTMSNISNVVIAEISENKAGALNILHASFAVGALLAPFIAIVAIAAGAGWRTAVLIVAAFEVVVLLVLWRSRLSNTPSPRMKDGSRDFIRSGSYWLNTAILFCYLCAEASIIGWLVTYFKDSGIMGGALAQSTSTLLWIMVMSGRLICAAISGRVDKNKLLIVMTSLMTLFFVLMIAAQNILIILPCLLGVGVSMSGIYPTTLSTMDPRYTSSTVATGTCIAVATVGAILMPSIVGGIAQKGGIAGGIWAISAALFAMLSLIVVKYLAEKKTGGTIPQTHLETGKDAVK